MIKKLIEKFFGKFCKCEKKDAPVVLHEDAPKPKVSIVESVIEKIKCNTHSRYKKSCPICVEASK